MYTFRAGAAILQPGKYAPHKEVNPNESMRESGDQPVPFHLVK